MPLPNTVLRLSNLTANGNSTLLGTWVISAMLTRGTTPTLCLPSAPTIRYGRRTWTRPRPSSRQPHTWCCQATTRPTASTPDQAVCGATEQLHLIRGSLEDARRASGGYRQHVVLVRPGPHSLDRLQHRDRLPNAPDQIATGLNAGPFQPSGTQLAWLEADLAAANANRANVPFIVVAGHRPWICIDQGDACVRVVPLSQHSRPSTTLTSPCMAHVHRYERSYPLITNMAQASNETSFISAETGAQYRCDG